MKQKPSISVIMPALNEEESVGAAIAGTLSVFDECGLDGEIVVINDGSTDGTPGLVKNKMEADKRVAVINHERPMGIGASFWDGVDSAKGELITMLPGDNENDPFETLRYAGLLENVDIVIPFAFNKNVRSFARNVISSLYLSIINLTFGTSFHYTNSTLIYRKSVLKRLKHRDSSFFFQTDILIKLVKAGYLFDEVPYFLQARRGGASKAVTFSSFLKVARGYLGLVKSVYFSGENGAAASDFAEDSMSRKRHQASGVHL